jgi:RNA recognition motif-containing protein
MDLFEYMRLFEEKAAQGKHPHIIVENLSYFCSENALLEHFNSEYPIKSVSVRLKNKEDGDSYPHSATVTLENPEHEDLMLRRFHGTLFMGKFLM